MTLKNIDTGFNLEYTEKIKKRIHVYPPHNKFLLILNLIKLVCSLAYSIFIIVYATLEPSFDTTMLVLVYFLGIFLTSYAMFETISEWRHGNNFKRALKIIKEEEGHDVQLVYADSDDDD